jgi:serine/threonine protein kinase
MLGKKKIAHKKSVQDNMKKRSLEDYVRDNGPLQSKEIYRITLNLCEALDNAENIDCLGRYPQLKPSNVIVCDSGKVAIAFNNIVETGKDFINIGTTMYFMIMGRVPFTVLETTFDDSYADNVDHDLKRIIRKCFEIHSRNQYASIKELGKDLSIMILKNNVLRQTRELCDSRVEVSISKVTKRVERLNKSKEKSKVIRLWTGIVTALKSIQNTIKKSKERLIFR